MSEDSKPELTDKYGWVYDPDAKLKMIRMSMALRSVLRQLEEKRDDWNRYGTEDTCIRLTRQSCAEALAPIIATCKEALGEKL